MRRVIAPAVFALALLAAGAAVAQESTAAALPTFEADVAARAPVEVPAPSPEAVRYYETGHWVWAASQALGVAIPWIVLMSGLAVALRSRAQRIARFWPLTAALVFIAYSIIEWLLSAPFSYYVGFARQHAYGLSNQSFGQWLQEDLTGLAVGLVIGALVIWVPYGLIRRLPNRWWLATGALLVPFLALIIFVKPLWIDPLTDDFGPMHDKPLEARILALADRAGIDGARVFEVAKSKDTNAVNAYVTGFGATKRIALWDTLLAKLTPEQSLIVMGHEMGHYVLRHVVISIVVYSLLATFGLYGVHRAALAALRRYGLRWRIDGLADPATLPLVMALVSVAFLVLSPAALAFSRHLEHEADRFTLELTQDNRSCALAFVALQQANLGYPRPGALYELLRASHPSLGERIDFCNEYRPWQHGEPLRYGARFRE